MRCIADNRQQTARGCGWTAIYVVLLLSVLETDKRNESDKSWNTRKSVSLIFRPWMAERGFPSLSAKKLVKSASTFLSAFRLLPRLEEVHIPCVRMPAARHASQDSGLPTRTTARKYAVRPLSERFSHAALLDRPSGRTEGDTRRGQGGLGAHVARLRGLGVPVRPRAF